MIRDEDIEDFLYRSGLTAPSVEALRSTFPRLKRHLAEKGFTSLPDSPLSSDWRGANEINRFVHEHALPEVRNAAAAHNLRNLTGVRPYKP